MERKAIVCCTLSLLLASCGGGGGTFVTDTASSTGTPGITGTTGTSSSQTDGQLPLSLIQATDGNFYGVTRYGGTNGVGTIFRLTTAGVETVLYSFAGGTADGAYPWGLIQGSDGNFYGTTEGGGVQTCSVPNSSGSGTTTGACGVVFKMTSTGEESVVYSFTGQSDGSVPTGRLIQASNGSLYGTAQFGGLSNSTDCPIGCGVVYQVTLGGTESALYSFKGSATGDGQDPTSVTLGTDGNLYGTTVSGGPGNFGTVFQVTIGGIETVLYSFLGTTDGNYPGAPLTEGADGSFYGTALFGGTGFGTVFNVTTAGVETTLYSFKGTPDGATPAGRPLVLATDGDFYGATDDGGSVTTCSSGCGTVFSLTTGGTESILYNFPAAGTTTSPLNPGPEVLIQGSNGTLYGTTVADGQYGYGTVYSMSLSGTKTVLYSFGAPN